MKCFGVELKQTNSSIKLKATCQEIKLQTSIDSNIRLSTKANEIQFNITPLIHLIKLQTRGLNSLINFNAYNSIDKLIKLYAKDNSQIILNVVNSKGIKLNIRGLNDIIFHINRYDDIIFICVPSCKLRRKYDYLRSLDDEQLIDIEEYLLKSIIDYGRERFN